MLYYLFEYLEGELNIPGAGLFQYITFRSGVAIILSLIISILIGKRIVRSLKKLQIGESVRDLGLEGQLAKEGTPTMGGLIIILSIMLPVLLMCKLDNIYIQLMILATLWMAIIGFIDDYIKIFKGNKAGLKGKFKVAGQVILGLVIALVMLYHQDIVIRMDYDQAVEEGYEIVSVQNQLQDDGAFIKTANVKSTMTNVPFFKDNNFDYKMLLGFLGKNAGKWVWIVFIPMMIIVISAVSNGANLTDGIDGLATGTSAIIGATLGIMAYVSGNTIIADYLNIFYIPDTAELVVFSAAFIGACVGFLWYNSFPATVFMGDTGSLALGSIIAVLSILLRKELLIPILCGIFMVETISVILQVSYFKYTKKRSGVGKRMFLMAPLHHHYQKKGIHESKIVTRFWIVGILLAVIAIITLKIR